MYFPSDRLDPTREPRDAEFLAQIQGGNLRPHGRDEARLLFFRFHCTSLEQWSRALIAAGRLVTSALEQTEQARRFHARAPEAEAFRTFGLTATGLAALPRYREWMKFNHTSGLQTVSKVYSPRPFDPAKHPSPDFFHGGGPGYGRRLEQPFTCQTFEPPFSGRNAYPDEHPDTMCDAWWLVACDDIPRLEREVGELVRWGHAHGLLLHHLEVATTWRMPAAVPDHAYTREPFGFVDGISLPSFFATDPPAHPSIDLPLWQAVIPPYCSLEHAGGSFLAYAKFEQNVAAFRAAERQPGAASTARSIGRTREGEPLVSHPPAPGNLNEFDFVADRPAPPKCPFHAHIRKLNPRDPLEKIERNEIAGSLQSQAVRRSMIYDPGRRLPFGEARALAGKNDGWPQEGVGLHFMAYMTSLREQFHTPFSGWSVENDHPYSGSGPDALLRPAGPTWITLRGLEFLYVPSLPWLARGGC